MPQILATVVSYHDEDRHTHVYPTPIEIFLSVGPSYTLASTPTSGSVLRDTATKSEYIIQESESVIRARLIEADFSSIKFADSPSVDAFARLRISPPFTLFDSKQIHDNKPLFWDDKEVSGSGTASVYVSNQASDKMSVGTGAGKRIRQTKERFNYQPGKSQLIILTFDFDSLDTGVTKEVGYFDDNNGVFLRGVGSTLSFVMRSNTTGSPVDTMEVARSSWNVDKFDGTGASGVTLDFTKTQLFFMDLEWLGVGRVRYGFYHNGLPLYAHYMQHSNIFSSVYMSTPNLPVRYSIENDGTGVASDLYHLCSTVISEGGQQDTGTLRYASTNGTHVDANVANTVYAVVGIRLKAAHLDGVVKEIAMSMLAETNDNYEWLIIMNPDVAGTFTYSDETNSIVQVARGALANVVTNGIPLNGGWGQQKAILDNLLENSLRLGSLIDGTPDELVLCVRPLSTMLDIQGGITWRELS